MTVGRLFGAVLGALTVLLLILIVRRIWGIRIALVAGGLAAIFPPLIAISTELYSENLFIPLLLAATLTAVRCRESAELRWALATGALAGLAALTRGPGVIALLPLLFGLWTLRPRFSSRALLAPATALLCAALVITPWAIRNATEFGRFVPIATSTGFGLAGTYNEVSLDDQFATAAWRTPAIVPAYAPLFTTPGVDEATLDSTLRRESTDFAADHPGYVLEASIHNLLRLTYLEGSSVVAYGEEVKQTGIGNSGSAADAIGLGLAMVLAVIGAWTLWGRRGRVADAAETGRIQPMFLPKGPTFLWLIPLALILVAAPVAGLPRYRVPADPFLLILSAIGLLRLLQLASIRWRRRGIVTVLGVLSAFALSGCGGSGDSASPETTSAAPSPSGGPSRAAYIADADKICAQANAAAGEIVDDFARANLPAGGVLALTTEELVSPGVAVRSRQAEELRALRAPSGDDQDLATFLGLFDPIEELSRQRLAAGRAGDPEDSAALEKLLLPLAVEQQAAARRYGFDDCSEDVLGSAFR